MNCWLYCTLHKFIYTHFYVLFKCSNFLQNTYSQKIISLLTCLQADINTPPPSNPHPFQFGKRPSLLRAKASYPSRLMGFLAHRKENQPLHSTSTNLLVGCFQRRSVKIVPPNIIFYFKQVGETKDEIYIGKEGSLDHLDYFDQDYNYLINLITTDYLIISNLLFGLF